MTGQAVTHPTILVSSALPLCGTLMSTMGSLNVFIGGKPALKQTDVIIPSVPVIPLVLPMAQVSEVARYGATSQGSVSVSITPDPLGVTFAWPLVTTPRPNPLSGSKSVLINNIPCMRVTDQIIPPTFIFKPETHTVFVGG